MKQIYFPRTIRVHAIMSGTSVFRSPIENKKSQCINFNVCIWRSSYPFQVCQWFAQKLQIIVQVTFLNVFVSSLKFGRESRILDNFLLIKPFEYFNYSLFKYVFKNITHDLFKYLFRYSFSTSWRMTSNSSVTWNGNCIK